MPRKKHLSIPGMCHHVMLRGIDGKAVFFDSRVRASLFLGGINLGDVCRILNKNPGTVSRWASRKMKKPHLDSIVNELVKPFS